MDPSLDSRWSFGQAANNAISVHWDGWQVARFQGQEMIITANLPPPLDLQLLLIRERQLGSMAIPEWRAENGRIYFGATLVFEWLIDLDPYLPIEFVHNELKVYFCLHDRTCCHKPTFVLYRLPHSNCYRLKNHRAERFDCRHPELIDRLLQELIDRPRSEGIAECRAWLATADPKVDRDLSDQT